MHHDGRFSLSYIRRHGIFGDMGAVAIGAGWRIHRRKMDWMIGIIRVQGSGKVLIWDVEAQPHRHALLGAADSRPDLVISGHQDNAEFALAMCPAEPFVLSGAMAGAAPEGSQFDARQFDTKLSELSSSQLT